MGRATRPVRRVLRASLVVLALTVVQGCVDGETPVSESTLLDVPLAMSIRPDYSTTSVADQPLPINLIRVSVYRADDGTFLDDWFREVDPNAEAWSLEVGVSIPEDVARVRIVVELVHRNGEGEEFVEWSGQIASFAVAAARGGVGNVGSVDVVRGPIDNLAVVGVDVTPEESTIPEGGTVGLTATVNANGNADPIVYWGSLDPAVATVDASGEVSGVAPGLARIEAVAGGERDEVVVEVVARPADLVVDPPVHEVDALPAEVAFAARVVDVRGDEAGDQAVVWESLDPGLLESLGGGLFRVLGSGEGRVRATSVANPELTGEGRVVSTGTAADLAVSKTADPAEAFEDDVVTFEVVVENRGPDEAAAVSVQDAMDEGLTLVDHQAGVGTFDPSSGLWSVGALAPGSSATLTLRARVEVGTFGETLVNRASVSGDVDLDPNAGNDEASAGVRVAARLADLSVEKSVDDPTPFEGDLVTFTLRVSNAGPSDAGEVVVLDELPPGLTHVTASGDGSFDPVSGRWTLSGVPAGGSRSLELRVRVDEDTVDEVLVNRVTIVEHPEVSDPDGSDDAAQASVTVAERVADVGVTKTAGVEAAEVGDQVLFTVVVTNDGPQAATGVQLREDPDPGLTVTEYEVDRGTVDEEIGVWSVGTLQPGESGTLTVRVAVDALPEGGTLTNRAELLPLEDVVDPEPENDAAQATIEVTDRSADLSVVKTVDVETPFEQDTVTFTVVFTNPGPTEVRNVVVRDELPQGLAYLSHEGDGSFDPGTGSWTLGTVAPGTSDTLVVKAVVAVGTVGETLTNVASTESFEGVNDPDTGNNGDGASVVPSGIDLEVTKTVDPTDPVQGAPVSFTVTVRNKGGRSATGVEVEDKLPQGLTPQATAPEQGTYDGGTGVWAVGDIPAGESVTLVIDALVDGGVAPGTTLVNEAQRTATVQTDTFPPNDVDQAAVTVQNRAPTADAANTITSDETAVTLTLTGSDPDGDALAFSVDTPPGTGSLGSITTTSPTTAEVTYTPAVDGFGDDTFVFQVIDPSGAAATAVVTVTVNDLAEDGAFDVVGNTELVAGPVDTPPSTLHTTATAGLLGDPTNLTVTGVQECGGSLACTLPSGAALSVEADGGFSYVPAVGSTSDDAFTFDTDKGGSGQVSLTATGDVVKYVDNSAGGTGTGLSSDPFVSLQDAQSVFLGPAMTAPSEEPAAAAPAGETVIYVSLGGGSYDGSFTLNTGERLVGSGADLIVGGVTIATAGTAPLLTASGTVIRMADGSTVEGVDIEANGGDAIDADGLTGSATIRDVLIGNPAGSAILIRNGTADVTIDSVTVNDPGDTGIRVVSDDGTVTVTGSQINHSGPGSLGVQVFQGAPTFSYSGGIATSADAFALIQVDSTTGGSVELRRGPFDAVADTAARFKHAQGSIRVDSMTIQAGTRVGVTIETTDTTSNPGSYDFNQLDIDDPAVVGFALSRGAPTVDVELTPTSLTSTNPSAAAAVDIASLAAGGSVTFSGGPVVVSGSGGIAITNNYGTVTFQNDITMTNPTGDAGIDITGIYGTAHFLGVVDITTDSNAGGSERAVLASGDRADVHFNSLSILATDAQALDVFLYPVDCVQPYGTFSGDFPSIVVNGSSPTYERSVQIQYAEGTKTFGTLTIDDHQTTGSFPDAGLDVFQGGTIEVIDPASSIGAVGAPAMEFRSTTIGSAGLNFRSLSSDGSSNGAGVWVNDTGTSGSLNVAGDGSTLGSGGLITNHDDYGVYLSNTMAPSLAFLDITGGSDDGVYATGVSDLTLDRLRVTSAGVAGSPGDDALSIVNPTGTALVSNTVVDQSHERGLSVVNNAGTGSVVIQSSTFSNSGQDGVEFRILNGGLTATVTGSAFDSNTSHGIEAIASGGTLDLTVGTPGFGNSFASNDRGVRLNTSGGTSTRLDFDVNDNTFSGHGFSSVLVENSDGLAAGAGVEGFIRNNTVSTDQSTGRSIHVNIPDGTGVVDVSSNSLGSAGTPLGGGVTDPFGIDVDVGGGPGNSADGDVTVRNNTIFTGTVPGVSVGQFDAGAVCLDLRSNAVSTSGSDFDMQVFKGSGTFEVEGVTTGALTALQTAAELSNLNNSVSVDAFLSSGSFTGVADGTCTGPN